MLYSATRVLLQRQQRLDSPFFILAALGVLCLRLISLAPTESDHLRRRIASMLGLDGEVGLRGYLAERQKAKLGETIGDLMRVMMFRMVFSFLFPFAICLVCIGIGWWNPREKRKLYFSLGGVSGLNYRGFEK